MIIDHRYIDKYPIDKASRKLILGTIHPSDHSKFKTEFFYGNTNSLWLILADAFPEEFDKPVTVENILKFLSRRKLSVSDTILSCEREIHGSSDEELKNIILNVSLIEQIAASDISQIFFTSGFGKNGAFRLFFEGILKQKITSDIRNKREVILDKEVFGRAVKLTVLYSPSGAANIAFARHKDFVANRGKYSSSKPVWEFKVEYYRKKFSE